MWRLIGARARGRVSVRILESGEVDLSWCLDSPFDQHTLYRGGGVGVECRVMRWDQKDAIGGDGG